MSKEKKLKAYIVTEDYEGHSCLIFATNSATARREGAGELGTEWDGIESCRRAPQFDEYAEIGTVPVMVLIEYGWWYECSHCGRRVHKDMADDLDSEGLDPAEFMPRPNGGHGAFCSESCECADHMARRRRAEATEALLDVFEAKFPGATVVSVHVYNGPKLVENEPGRPIRNCVSFTFPGSTRGAQWSFGDAFAMISNIDAKAYRDWQNGLSNE
jgi:hypothetical protein